MHTSKSSFLDSNIEKWTALATYKLNTAFWTQKLPHCSSRGWSLHISPGHLENPAHILCWKCGSYGMLWPSQVSRLSAIQRCGRFCIPLRPLAVRPRLIEWKVRKVHTTLICGQFLGHLSSKDSIQTIGFGRKKFAQQPGGLKIARLTHCLHNSFAKLSKWTLPLPFDTCHLATCSSIFMGMVWGWGNSIRFLCMGVLPCQMWHPGDPWGIRCKFQLTERNLATNKELSVAFSQLADRASWCCLQAS